MPKDQKFLNQVLIIGGIVIILIVILMCFCRNNRRPQPVELFSPYESQRELDQYYESPVEGIQDYLVDTMVCSKKCCGDQWPVPFEGLTSAEIQQSISTPRDPGPFVRTNYTCANGIEGVGCPCISKDAYRFIVNKGRNEHNIDHNIQIEPTFLITGNEPKRHDYHTPYQTLQAYRSMFVDSPRLNDLELSRSPNPVNDVDPIHYKSASAGY